jgi:DNA-binding NtrC family response regulator
LKKKVVLLQSQKLVMTQQELQAIKLRFGIIGQNALLNRGIEIAVQVARTDLSVLITGESGVGKEHFPKIIHAYSARKHGPYFAVNCGAIPEGTIDSELFGHEKGAFTDAKNEHKGYFEIADGGTLFLDEVGELPLQTQVRLLRVLETGEYMRMGSAQVRKTNVRVVAATNLNMRQAIDDGRFREDLYYRLNTVEIRVPALRERKEDIPLLFRKFAVDFCNRYQMPPLSLNEEATQLLQAAYWRGNIRQLKNLAEQIAVIEMDHQINAETLRKYLPKEENQQSIVLRNPSEQINGKDYSQEISILYNMLVKTQQELRELRESLPNPSLKGGQQGQPTSFPSGEDRGEASRLEAREVIDAEAEVIGSRRIEDANKELIRTTLEQCEGNRKMAAERLGISERTLYRKIKEYDL